MMILIESAVFLTEIDLPFTLKLGSICWKKCSVVKLNFYKNKVFYKVRTLIRLCLFCIQFDANSIPGTLRTDRGIFLLFFFVIIRLSIIVVIFKIHID